MIAETWIISTTYGFIARGFESYAEDLVDHCRAEGMNDIKLIKCFGKSDEKSRKIVNLLALNTSIPFLLARIFPRKSAYFFHVFGFVLSLLPKILLYKPKSVYAIEVPVFKALIFIKKRLGLNFKLITYSGGQINRPFDFDEQCYFHYVTPNKSTIIDQMGLPERNQIFAPHFLEATFPAVDNSNAEKAKVRARLGLPLDSAIILSVGGINKEKGMHRLIEELECIWRERDDVFVLIIGQPGEQTVEIKALADIKLRTNYKMLKCSRKEIKSYYLAADLFVLASPKEGFGLVYLEALSFGLPVIAHDFAESRYVLNEYGTFVDVNEPGELQAAIRRTLSTETSEEEKKKRRDYVRMNFSWDKLKNKYIELLA